MLFAFCATLTAAATPTRAQQPSPIPIEKIQIAEGIYQFASAPDGYVPDDNSIVIINSDDVLVFDTLGRPSSARTVLAEIRKLTDKPVRYVVNSHHHPDHWSGNEVFAAAFPNLEIISTEASRQYMVSLAKTWPLVWTNRLKQSQAALDEETKSGKNPDGSAVTAEQRANDENDVRLLAGWLAELNQLTRTYPTLTFGDSLTLRHGGREFRFFNITGDATGTTALYLPKEKLLLVGDTISSPIPGFNTNLLPSHFLKSLKFLAQLDADTIIPGHGPALRGKNYLNLEIELLDSLTSQVNEAVQKELVTVEDIQKAVNVDSFREKFTHNDKDLNAEFQSSVNRMIDALSREARDGRKWLQ